MAWMAGGGSKTKRSTTAWPRSGACSGSPSSPKKSPPIRPLATSPSCRSGSRAVRDLDATITRRSSTLRSDAASQKCLAWLREVVGITDVDHKGKYIFVFHSTRHAIKTYMRGSADREVHDWITGHTDGSVSGQYGETEIKAMAKAIALIK